MDLSTQDNPNTTGAQQTGESSGPENTIDAQSQTDADAQAGDTGSPAEVSDSSTPVDKGTETRLQQDLANQRKTLAALGIDPDGQTADMLRSGMLSREDVLRMITPQQQQQPQQQQPTEPASPDKTLETAISRIKQRAESNAETISADDYRKDMAAVLDVVNLLQQRDNTLVSKLEQSEIEQAQNRNIAASKSVYTRDDEFKNLPAEVQNAAGDLILGAADVIVGQLAREVGMQRAFTAQGYQVATEKSLDKFRAVVKAAYEAGANSVKKQIEPQGDQINPLPAGTGSGTAPPRRERITDDNLEAARNRYLAGRRPVV